MDFAHNDGAILDAKLIEIESHLEQSLAEKKTLLQLAKELQDENERLREKLNTAEKNLKEESLRRSNLEKIVSCMTVESPTREEIVKQKIDETGARQQVKKANILLII